jgi:phosphotransferase system enzyme I (PtsI)
MMVGIVVVSHSPALAKAAVSLALAMTVGQSLRIEIAAGAGDDVIGTDVLRIAEAIKKVSNSKGVLVIMDLGSAIMSSEMALEFIDDKTLDVRLSRGPFVEGLLAAVVRAVGGGSLDEVEDEAANALMAKALQLGTVPPISPNEPITHIHTLNEPETTGQTVLVNAIGLHARPAAMIVTAIADFDAHVQIASEFSKVVPANSPTALVGLAAKCGQTLHIQATGPDAKKAVDLIIDLINDGFGEPDEPDLPSLKFQNSPTGAIGVSSGRIVGPVVQLRQPISEPDVKIVLELGERKIAVQQLKLAVAQVADWFKLQSARMEGSAKDIMQATSLIATDPALVNAACEAIINGGLTPARAIWEATESIISAFSIQGGLLAERVADLHDIRNRIIGVLTGQDLPSISMANSPYILVASDLAPADTIMLNPHDCLAIVTEKGGPTSHSAILARSLGIPAIAGVDRATAIAEGTIVLVDGATGEFVISPNDEQVSSANIIAPISVFHGPGRTSDGYEIPILANIGSVADVTEAIALGAEGIGLFRTEFCFLDREDAPSIAEQVIAYRAVFNGFSGRKVVIRTLDAGSDKPLPFLSIKNEANPALGIRGYRTSWHSPEILDNQLTSIAQAAAAEHADVWVMAPMIATVEEASAFVKQARAAGLATVGVMIETPSAAIMADRLFEQVDFVSIGTNDLAQYTLAADRMSSDLAALNDPWQPSLLRMIELVCRGALDSKKPVGVCGEAAADPYLAIVLVGLGVSTLSMSARSIPAVGQYLASLSLEDCRRAAQAARNSDNAQAARVAVKESLSLVIK